MDERFGLSRIGQVHVPVRDLERSISFYREALGIEYLFRAPPGMAFFRCGDVTLLLGAAEGSGGGAGTSVLYFLVEDVEEAHRILTARGVEFRGAPHRVHRADEHELWMVFFRDSEGNTMALMERRPT